MNWKITQVNPYIDNDELELIKKCISDKWLTEGAQTNELLTNFSELSGTKHVLPVPNGTLGLYLALLSLDLPKGSEVLVPSFTFFGSVSSIHFAGLIPRFVDVDEGDYMATVKHYESAITNKTSAIMPIHIYGASADMDPIMKLAKKNNLKVVEDAAQAVGVQYKGEHSGNKGDVSVFSFFADKTVTMGEGGLITTNNEELFEKIKLIRNQGRPNSGTFIHPAFGMNFRVTDMQSAVGNSQLKKLKHVIKQKDFLFSLYSDRLNENKEIRVMKPKDYSSYIPFRFAFTSSIKDKIEKALNEAKIQTRGFFYPMHLQPAVLSEYSFAKNIELSVSERLNKEGLCLPMHLGITEANIDFICSVINESTK